jgi:hypothetical protein
MDRPLPCEMFEYMRPDEIAETVDGIPDNLYRKLWDCVGKYNPSEVDIENSAPCDILRDNAVGLFWNDFTPEECAQLNSICADI